MTRLAFVDTETTGLALDDDIWEFAAIIREPDGTEWTYHLYIEHNAERCDALPEPFWTDHRARFPSTSTDASHPDVKSREEAAHEIAKILSGGPHIVGAVPNFDTERIAILLRKFGLEPEWHYHLIDVENLAVGYLNGQAAKKFTLDHIPGSGETQQTYLHNAAKSLPWDSNDLSRAVGVNPDAYDRHTALGDAKWARDQYDAITGYSPVQEVASDAADA